MWLELKKIPATNLCKSRVGGNFRLFLFLYNFWKRTARYWSIGGCKG